MKKQKAALVCSGGGALGAAHLGVLKELEKEGREYDFFVGVSAGSIVCAMKAFGMTTTEILDFAMETNFFEMGLDFSRSNFGLLGGDKFMKTLIKIFGDTRIEDLKYPLFIGATDFNTGERIILTQGEIVDALRASCGVPVLFKPFYHEEQERWLVDGGLTQNFPLDIALEHYTGDLITGIDVSGAFETEINFEKDEFWGRTKDLQNIITRTFRIMFLAQQNNFAQSDRVELFQPEVGHLQAINVRTKNLQEIYACGQKCVREKLFIG